jgi:hypothetical protein
MTEQLDNPDDFRLRLIDIIGGLTPQPSAADQPVATLVRWRFLRASTGLHLVGYCLERCEGRVSSAIVRVDLASRQCASVSGRNYVLRGPGGHDEDAAWVWSQVAGSNGLTEDLTSELEANLAPEVWQ